MRDRLPIGQTDRVQANGELRIVHGDPRRGGRVIVQAHDNIALIRSGQDWVATETDERRLYLDEIEPTLHDGMNFLRDNGADVGCYSNRYVRSIDLEGNLLDGATTSATGVR